MRTIAVLALIFALLGGCAPLVVGAAGGLAAYSYANWRRHHHCWRDQRGVWHGCRQVYVAPRHR